MKQLQSVEIERFKRLDRASFNIEDLNILVGGNNAGKSSIIQGLHFAVSLLQTIGLSGSWTSSSNVLSTSLNPNQLIYCPSEDVYALGPGGKLLEAKDKSTDFTFNFKDGTTCKIEVRKGRNRNILVSINDINLAKTLASLEKPFSIFSPGLAGIAKRETYVADGVLLRALARGDANLVLRNILWRLWEKTSAWPLFITDIQEIFPGLEIKIEFDISTDEHINVQINTGLAWVPLEIAGTGVLQAIQILSYIHQYSPSFIVLDEPDSHLHPNNQRLLCALLREVAEDRKTQVLLTTHSRHVVDALGAASQLLWVRKGQVDPASADDEIGILMEIGALDIKERAGQPGTKAIVLTEDEITRSLELILE